MALINNPHIFNIEFREPQRLQNHNQPPINLTLEDIYNPINRPVIRQRIDTPAVFFCKMPGCPRSWRKRYLKYEPTIIVCDICRSFNCLDCKSIHNSQHIIECRIRKLKKDRRKFEFNQQGFIMTDLDSIATSEFNREKEEDPNERRLRLLLEFDNDPFIPNDRTFECPVCFDDIELNEGICIRECFHEICKLCLAGCVENDDRASLVCPYKDNEITCEATFQEREIKALVSKEIFEMYLLRSLRQAQAEMKNSFQCRTTDCNGIWVYNDEDTNAMCPICEILNCHHCRAIHSGMTCKEYQDKIFDENDPSARETRQFLEGLVSTGEAMHCPQCNVIIARNEGCDWVQCSICKTEICWATKGPRWGPKGKGDTTGGCRCGGTNGPKCHPTCKYCH